MSAEADCLFCKIIAGEIPAERVDEDADTIAFMDINPGSTGHALVIPKKHARDLLEIDDDSLSAVAVAAKRLAGRAVDRLGAEGVNLLNCCGPVAWQTVFHFHMHVVPRYTDDSLQLPWRPVAGDPDAIAATAAALRGSD
ncbi:HIT family protein [Rudaeicoccus suwonensis]|uniref:Histidine triad (HIT) family protein n=1 Tax=Rudaeicoccus suwonensis TaxID=657409 RepID=A0A561E8F3_9MICO|nr:HIT family protein [Rudaeicoccus suwonensis]TWE11840.1 histidine triad (HIT) family protein [Rudaeicoccus suwonensis]